MPASMPLSAVGRKQHAKYDPWLFVDRPSSAQRQKNAAGSAAAAPRQRLSDRRRRRLLLRELFAERRCGELVVVTRCRRKLRSQAAEVGGGGDHHRRSTLTPRRVGLLLGENQNPIRKKIRAGIRQLYVLYITGGFQKGAPASNSQ